jgi:hypothetical protein
MPKKTYIRCDPAAAISQSHMPQTVSSLTNFLHPLSYEQISGDGGPGDIKLLVTFVFEAPALCRFSGAYDMFLYPILLQWANKCGYHYVLCIE